MELGLEGKRALAAAASKGLGKAFAIELAKEGAHVAICSRSRENLDKAMLDLKGVARNPGKQKFMAFECNLAREDERAKLGREVREAFQGLDILFVNSGGPPAKSFMETTDEDWKSAVSLNLMSSVSLVREFLQGMIIQKYGRILFSTSVAVKQPLDGLILSNSVRAGVAGLAKTLANELAPHGVTVNCILPGWTWTERVEALVSARSRALQISPEEFVKNIVSSIPLGRIGKPEEFAWVAAFLVSERASFVTGASIQVDGGSCKGLL